MISLWSGMSKRARSSKLQFRVRVPAEVLPVLRGKRVLLHMSQTAGTPFVRTVTIGSDVAFSLDTRDAFIAENRQADALRHLRQLFALTVSPPIRLSHRDQIALSKSAYDLWIAVHQENPGEPLMIRYHKALDRAALEGRIANPPESSLTFDAKDGTRLFGPSGDDLTGRVDALPAGMHDGLEDRFGLLADWVLIRHGINLTPEDRRTFLRHVGTASLDAGWQLRRNAEGDYTPDPKAARFPPIDSVQAVVPRQTITGLFEDWSVQARALKRAARTVQLYEKALGRLLTFLKHDDANRVTEDDLIAYQDHRLQSVTPKTFRDGDLPALKQVFKFGRRRRLIAVDPVAEIRVPRESRNVIRDPDFTDAEAQAIFVACLSYTRGLKEAASTAAAKRWSPLVAAYTGCRISEALQLRRCDVAEIDGYPAITFTPEAGSIKSRRFRTVPIHADLIRIGFLSFVEQSGDGPLFAKGAYKRVYDFVRSVVPDTNVQPNHGWRHRFKSVSLDLGLDARVIEAIQGHAPRTASDTYGKVSMTAKARAIAAMPAIPVTIKALPQPSPSVPHPQPAA